MSDFPFSDHVQCQLRERKLVLQVCGHWKVERAAPHFAAIVEQLPSDVALDEVEVSSEALGEWDSSLLIFLDQAKRWCGSQHVIFNPEQLPKGLQSLLNQVQAVIDSRVEAKDPEGHPDFATEVGSTTLGVLQDLKVFVDFLGDIVISAGRMLVNRSQMRWADCMRSMQDSGAMALPIVGLISFLVGLTLAFQAAVLLADFGAEVYTATFVSLSMVREMGPLMTAVVLAGRTGASFAANIGAMKVSEEIDALRTLGVSPIDYLVLPRVLGLCVMVPLMVIYSNMLGMLGGFVVGRLVLGMPVKAYIHESFVNMDMTDVGSGLLKASVFGAIIAYAGCLRGMNADTSSTGVGKATTSAVVTSLLMIIVANAIFAVIYSIYDI